MNIQHLIAKSLAFCALALISIDAFAATVSQVKGSSVLIDVEDSTIESGKKYFLVIDGKKKAVVQIKQVKGAKALGTVTRGKAAVGATLEASGGGGGSKSARRGKRGGGDTSHIEPGFFIGGLLGYGMSSQSVKAPAETVSMSGGSINAKAFGDYSLSESLGLIIRGGVEQLNVSGNSKTQGTLKTEIMYLSADALLRYTFMNGAIQPYVAGGMGLYFPLSKKSTALDETRIASSTVFIGGGGVNYFMSPDLMITAIVEYDMYPPSNDVSTSAITLRAGAGFRF